MNSNAGTPFWQFSLQLYQQAQVAESCLQLQDTDSVDVNVMLFVLWLASQHRELSVADLEFIEAAVANWKQDVVLPLRAIRRGLKQAGDRYGTIDSENFRNRIKALELQSEKAQQDLLYELKTPEQWGTVQATKLDAAKNNLHAYEKALGTRFGAQDLKPIFAALIE